MSVDATSLPSELMATPQPLVGFYGLDLINNSVHNAVWDTFSNNRKVDRASVNLKVLAKNYEFPITKPKRASYEWYQPKGIMKRNWMLKHLYVLPAVVVYFKELEWNDVQWSEKQIQCAAAMHSLKSQLQDRNTRICLVLLQKIIPSSVRGEDPLVTERAASLSNACGISNKMIYLLPYTENISGYALRLESAFLDMAQSYYTLMAKRIRSHRDQLTAVHITLKIRHQFKLGFVAEIRQDYSTALKHYTQAYTNLDEIQVADGNCFEMKTFAGFLNYKICNLMFKLKVPRDAINHFISHVEKYKNRVGFADLIFEHFAWLSTQHSVFAELFCDAIRNGLPALQTQHPGIYYHKAAKYMSRRREAFRHSCAILISPTECNISAGSVLSNDYFGIYSLNAGESISAQQIFNVLRLTEKNFNHTVTIINLLSQAMVQFRTYKCPRYRKKLAINMAEEYFKSGDHAKALTLYSLMLPDYREEKWTPIFADVLLKTLRAAMLSGSVGDYVSCSIEALLPKITHDHKDRVQVLENLWKVFQGYPPVSQSQLVPEIISTWENSLQYVKSPIHIDMNKTLDLFEICVNFENDEIRQDEILRVQLIIRTLTDVPIKLYDMALFLTDDINTYKLPVKNYAKYTSVKEFRERYEKQPNLSIEYCHHIDHELKLEANIYYELQLMSEGQHFMENTQLRAVRFEAFMGSDKMCTHLTKSMNYEHQTFRSYNCNKFFDDIIPIKPICCIMPTFHIVTQSNIDNSNVSMLANEFFIVTTNVSNPHKVYLQQVGLNISVPSYLRQKVFLTTDISPSRQKLHSTIQIDLGELEMNGTNNLYYYVFSMIGMTINLQQKIWYTLDGIPMQKSSNLIVMPNHNSKSADSSDDNSPDNFADRLDKQLIETTTNTNITNSTSQKTIRSTPPVMLAKSFKPVHIELLDQSAVRKSCDDVINLKCDLEFNVQAQLYTLNKKQLNKLYRGERFLLRINYEVNAPCDLDILDTFFICEPDFMQSPYSYKGRKYGKVYEHNDRLEDVIMLQTFAMGEQKAENANFQPLLNNNRQIRKNENNITICDNINKKSQDENTTNAFTEAVSSRVIYHKALEAVQATGNCRDFIKGVFTTDQGANKVRPTFGVYCIKWRRNGQTDENESKYVIKGVNIENPLLNIYCSIEERIFVKMPMTLKVVLKNPTNKTVHLTATLKISLSDNFICSGHKQLDVSLFSCGEKTLVYNLYPLCVGWQNTPELTLEYNTQVDSSVDESQNVHLHELVERSIPKRIFVLPPLKQHSISI